jgi:hypothetical protein
MVRYKCMDCMWGPCTVIAQADSSPPRRCLWAEPNEKEPAGYFEVVSPKKKSSHKDFFNPPVGCNEVRGP